MHINYLQHELETECHELPNSREVPTGDNTAQRSFVDTIEIETGRETQANYCKCVVVDQRTKFRLKITFAVPVYLQSNRKQIIGETKANFQSTRRGKVQTLTDDKNSFLNSPSSNTQVDFILH